MVIPENAPVPKMVSFSCADHIPSRLRTSLILLQNVMISLRGIKGVFYLLGFILNLTCFAMNTNSYCCMHLISIIIKYLSLLRLIRQLPILHDNMLQAWNISSYLP